jgi:hypothetical protein
LGAGDLFGQFGGPLLAGYHADLAFGAELIFGPFG